LDEGGKVRVIEFADGFETDIEPDVDGFPASSIAINPVGNVNSTDVQSAIAELDTEKVGKISSTDNAVVRFSGTSGDVQDSAVTVDDDGNLNVPGNLTVAGTTTTINSVDLDVQDRNITVNKGGTDISSDGAGLTVEREGDNGSLVYNSSAASKWKIGAVGSEVEVVDISSVQALSNKSLVAPTVDVAKLTEQGITPSTPSAGTKKLYAKNDGKLYTLNSAGTETEVGSGAGGSGSKNYAQQLYTGDSITGLNTYADAAATTPVDGTGGTATGLTTAVNSVSPLRGIANQRFSKNASNCQGKGWSFDYTLERADFEGGRPIIVQFKYKTSANYASSDIAVFAYDKDTSALIPVTSLGGENLGAASTVQTFTGVFFGNGTSDDYRFIWHITSTNATAWDFDMIDFRVGPNQVIPGLSGGSLGTEAWVDNQANATTQVILTRVGNRIFAEGVTTFSGAASSNLEVTIPNAYAADAISYPSVAGANAYQVGDKVEMLDVSTNATQPGEVMLFGNNTTLRIYWYNSAGSALQTGVAAASPWTWASGDTVKWSADWVVSGWNMGASLSTTEALFSSAQFTARRSTNQSIGSASATKVTWDNITKDNLGWWNATNNRVVIKKKMRYLVQASAGTGSASSEAYTLYVYVNGTQALANYVNGANPTIPVSGALDLNPNDYVEVFIQSTADTSYTVNANNYTFFSITAAPELSSYSVYGQFELLTATSSVKTPSASSRFADMTGNSIQLTPGTWRLWGTVSFGANTTPAYTFGGAGFYAANGGDSASVPALLTTLPGLTMLTANPSSDTVGLLIYSGIGATNAALGTPPIIVRVSQSTTVYFVPYATMTTAAQARLTAYAYAERLQ